MSDQNPSGPTPSVAGVWDGPEYASVDEGPSDEDRLEFAESIADHLTEHRRYPEMSKREAAAEAVRLVMDEARLETRRLLEPPGPMSFWDIAFTGTTAKDPTARSFPCLRVIQDGGTVEIEVTEERLISLMQAGMKVLGQLQYRRKHAAHRATDD